MAEIIIDRMRLLLLIIFGLYSIGLNAQQKSDSSLKLRVTKIETQTNEINTLIKEIPNLKDKIDYQQKLNEQTLNSISNQLSSASYILTLFGILFAISAIGLGIYVTFIERKIVKINEENKELLVKNQKIKQDVEDLNKLIQSDIYNLFLKIKREETVHILDRLIKVPKDIANVCESLLSRELIPDDFTKLKQAYSNLTDEDYKRQYNILFFQHFFDKSLKDETLRKPIGEYISLGVNAAFENDIIKTTKDFATILVDKGIVEYKLEINSFFEALAKSSYKDFSEVYITLYDNLKSRKNRFDIFTLVESTKEKRKAKINFGNLLIENYTNLTPTESETLVFKENEELSNQQIIQEREEKEKEEERIKQEEEKLKQRQERQKKQEEERLKRQANSSNG